MEAKVNPQEGAAKPISFANTLDEAPYHDYFIHFTHDGKKRDFVICEHNAAKTPLYVAVTARPISNKKPNVRLYSVKDISVSPEVLKDGRELRSKQAKAGDLLAVAYFPCFTRRIEMGFGSPDTPESVRWEIMTCPKIGVFECSIPANTASPLDDKQLQYSSQFSTRFDYADPSSLSPEGKSKGTTCQWRGTHTQVNLLGETATARRKLVTDQGEIIALLIPDGWKGLGRTGTLRIFKDRLGMVSDSENGIDKELEIRVIMTKCASVERSH